MKTAKFRQFLTQPEVLQVTRNENQALVDRRSNQPASCAVFDQPYSELRIDEGYVFEIDPEAHRLLPRIIANKVQAVCAAETPAPRLQASWERPRTIGIVFSGGPAPGGHNVIAGIFDAARRANPENRVIGFLMGPDGIIENQTVRLTDEMVDAYRNLGGFGLIKTGRTKIDSKDKLSRSRATCLALGLDALVVIGGDDSNTNAAFLAQELAPDGIQVIGVPKTIDGDVQVRDAHGRLLCAMSFGFHSAARAFSQDISNLGSDGSSDVKYWHICKVMGRVASHLALEVALQTHANIALIGEEIADYVDGARVKDAQAAGNTDFTAYGMTLRHLSRHICDGIVRRAAAGKNYGLMVIPEGILEFINEIGVFITKLNTIIAEYNATHDRDFHRGFPRLDDKLEFLRRLARRDAKSRFGRIWNMRDDDLFNDLPDFFQKGLLTERDSHGNFQFSQVNTEQVLIDLVKDYLDILKERGLYKVGIPKTYYRAILADGGLNPDYYGPVLFQDYNVDMLLVKKEIISLKTLRNALVQAKVLTRDAAIPAAVEKIYKKSVPSFKTQFHFYGYDGRGSDPTKFDCTYTYNLGLTAFSLIANGASGQMAAIRNLEQTFEHWEPIGIPIAPLMHLEERKGKLALVLERSLVELNSPAFKVVQAYREKWLAADPGPDHYRKPGAIHYAGSSEEDRPITLVLNALGADFTD